MTSGKQPVHMCIAQITTENKQTRARQDNLMGDLKHQRGSIYSQNCGKSSSKPSNLRAKLLGM
jgi:hypothetical protein